MKKVYIAGPMSGIPQFNYPEFLAMAKVLREQGFTVLCPAEMDSPEMQEAALASTTGNISDLAHTGETWGDVLAKDVKLVADEIDAVCLLKGWETSRGARLEAYVALSVMKPLYRAYADGMVKMDPLMVMREIAHHTTTRDKDKEKRYG